MALNKSDLTQIKNYIRRISTTQMDIIDHEIRILDLDGRIDSEQRRLSNSKSDSQSKLFSRNIENFQKDRLKIEDKILSCRKTIMQLEKELSRIEAKR